ncbi:MAG: hypothetical protein FWH08_05720 [Oscillospiraceae bacterium]|nr:hypothetical protein [Oscillospiraceae bacterium]
MGVISRGSGRFGLEGGVVCTLVIILGFAFTRFCIKKPDAENTWTFGSGLPMPFRRGKPVM